MKLKRDELDALSLLRQLDERQREKILDRMRREVLANEVVMKAAGLRKLQVVADKKIERAFGPAPIWRSGKKRK